MVTFLIGGETISDDRPLPVALRPGALTASETATDIAEGATVEIIEARATVSSAPTDGTGGYRVATDTVRLFIVKTGAITSARVRLYTREPGGNTWYRGSSTDDVVPIPAGEGNVSYDFAVGEGVEFTFVLEAIAPSGSTPTVAVKAAGVSNG